MEEAGEAHLGKSVVTETETVEVPVTHEEVKVVREPIAEGEQVVDNGNDEASVTLHEEKVTVNKETVPVEKVSLEKDAVQDTETVTETVRKEELDTPEVDNA